MIVSTTIWTIAGACVAIAPMILAAFVAVPGPPLVRMVLVAAWGIGATLWFEWWPGRASLQAAAVRLGVTATRPAVIVVALLACIPMWAFLPVVVSLQGTAIAVRPDWLSIVAGVVLVNGLAEEVIHRGYVFRRLRTTRSFARAVAIAGTVFAVQHLYLLITTGWIAGVAAVILAGLVALPLAHAYEQGGNSLGGPAIMHIGSNAPMLVFESPDGALTSLLVPYMGVVLLSMYGVFLLRDASTARGLKV